MPKKILNVVLVNSMCSQSGCKGSSQIVPDSPSRFNRSKRDPGTLTSMLEPLVDPVFVDSVRVLVKTKASGDRSSAIGHKIARATLFMGINRYFPRFPETTMSQFEGISTFRRESERTRTRSEVQLTYLQLQQFHVFP
jgi:hypothetical protein